MSDVLTDIQQLITFSRTHERTNIPVRSHLLATYSTNEMLPRLFSGLRLLRGVLPVERAIRRPRPDPLVADVGTL